MVESTQDRSRRVAATANRLRLIQADFADESVEARQECLAQVIQQALAEISPDHRQLFLDELGEMFPTWDAHQEVARASGEVGGTSITDQQEWQDVSFVAQRLIELAQPLSQEQRQGLADRLQDAGLSSVSDFHWPAKTLDELKSALRISPDQQVDAHRVLELVIQLGVFADSLDQLAWRIWKTISANKSKLRSTAPLKDTMKRFVAGQSDVPMSRNIEDLRHLIASLLSAIAQIGSQFARQHVQKFAPGEIEANVKLGPGSILVSSEVRCWRKYKELASDLDDAVIEREVMQIIERFVSTVRGR